MELTCLLEDKSQQFIELVQIPDAVAYQRRHDGEIICVYAGGSNKQKLRSWGDWLTRTHSVTNGYELREAKRLSTKWELKLTSMTLKQIDRLAACDFSLLPRRCYPDAPKRLPETAPPARPKIEVGDIVASTVVPTWQYEVLEVLGDGKLTCRRLGVKPDLVVPQSEWGVTLVSKAPKEDIDVMDLERDLEEKEQDAITSIQPGGSWTPICKGGKQQSPDGKQCKPGVV